MISENDSLEQDSAPLEEVDVTENVGGTPDPVPVTNQPDEKGEAEEADEKPTLFFPPIEGVKIDNEHSMLKHFPENPGDGVRYGIPGCRYGDFTTDVARVMMELSDVELEKLGRTKWAEVQAVGDQSYLRDGGDGFLSRPKGDWRPYLDAGDAKLASASPRLGGGGNVPLTGIQAMSKAAAFTSAGMIRQIPLWRTGIWVTIKAATNLELLELDRILANNKLTMGRVTRGRVFSQTDVFMKMAVVNFVLDHVIDTTWISTDRQELKKVIKLGDIQSLIWGMATTLYTKGFPFSQPCVADPGKCTFVAEGLITLREMQIVDNSMFTDWQRKHMLKRVKRTSREDQERYIEEWGVSNKEVFSHNGVHFRMEEPSIEQYELAGAAWIGAIQTSTEQAFTGKMDAAERDEFIYDQAEASAMRQYSHWISRITFRNIDTDDEVGFVENTSDIADQLGYFTADAEMAKAFYDGVGAFIDSTMVSVIAVHNFTCPSCKKRQPAGAAGKGNFEHYIPVEAVQLFFTLITHRLAKLKAVGHI